MIVTSIYQLALRLMPAELRRKHGVAMEALFAQEIEQARARGRLHGALAAVSGVWDVVARATYELMRPDFGANRETSHMTLPTTRQLLGRHAATFTIAFVLLTASMLFLFGSRQVPAMSARGASAGAIVQALLLAVPFTAAMTIPMAVFLAVLHEFTRLRANDTLAAARRSEVRRLVVTVLAAAVGVAAFALVVTAAVVPRTNERLSVMISGKEVAKGDRSMTIGELREAARNVGPLSDLNPTSRAAAYEVEVQKKFALPAACLVLAIAAMAIALRFPRGGTWLTIGASVAVFGAYYATIITGERLADQLVVSPVVGMWGANALMLSVALLAVWRGRGRHRRVYGTQGAGSPAG
jgi:lipopolysaccharide export LptBFGC system permease protein LptF